MSEDINIVSSKNLKLQGDISAKLYSNSASEFVNVNSSAVTLKHDTQVDIVTDEINYSNYTSETIVNENFTNGVNITYTASNVQTPIDNDNIRIAKQENIKINAREPVEVNKLYYNTGSSNDYIVQNENNLPPVPLTNADNRSGKLRSETTKTIIINCIPTIVDNSLSNPNSPTRPKHFIPMGEISENGFFDTLLPLGYAGDLNYQFATLAYGISSNHLLNIINFQNILRQKLETKTIPWNANDNKYDDFLTTNGLKFALIKRGKGLSTYQHADYDPETLNFEVNSELVKLDTTDSDHRDHILDYVKLNHGKTSDSIVKSVRKKLAIADKFYEADLVYMGVKPESHGKAYNDLTADDLDNSIEIRYLELKEFQSMIHNFSVSNGNNKVPFLLPEFVWNLFSPAYYNVQSLPQIARLTKTHWFKESFPIVRINSAKTNIINIDHAHNVDYLNELQFRLCLQRYPILNNPYFNKRIGKILSNRYGHNLYRTQLLTTYIDVAL